MNKVKRLQDRVRGRLLARDIPLLTMFTAYDGNSIEVLLKYNSALNFDLPKREGDWQLLEDRIVELAVLFDRPLVKP